MKRSELPECPHWLADCQCENENVEWHDNRPGTWIVWHGGVWRGGDWHGGDWRGGDWHGGVWHGGVWRGGDWHDGVWHGGVWRGGVWLGGDWRGGDWRGGVWHGGVWRGGDWHDGVWLGGVWRGGDWHGGVWHGGVWRGGVWLGGDWRGGDWRGGRTSIRTKWPVILEENGSISIGCKTKTRDEWEAWFAGTEAYSTPRDTEAFRQIHGAYRGLIAWMDTVNPPAITAPKVKAVRKRKAGA